MSVVSLNKINWGASFRWSLGPLPVWGSIESTIILTTHQNLIVLKNGKGDILVTILKNELKKLDFNEWNSSLIAGQGAKIRQGSRL